MIMKRRTSIGKSLDWFTIAMYLILVFMGWISVYGASYDFANPGIFDFGQRAGKQLLWIASSFVIGSVLLSIDNRVYEIFAYFIYAIVIALLTLTNFFATPIKGSHSWLVIGPISIQSAEFAKFAAGLAMAKFMSRHNFQLRGVKNYLSVAAIFLLPLLLIILQKEVGSALVFLAFFLVLYREGMPGVILYIALCCVAFFIFMIRLGDVPIFGENMAYGSLGLLLSLMMIIVSVIVFMLVHSKGIKPVKICLQAFAAVATIAILVNQFFVLDYNYFAFFYLAAVSVYLVVLSFKFRKIIGTYIVFFILASIAYCYSADYIFDRALQPHHQTRIKVVLGMEQDLQGSYYNVNQSKIAIGSGQFLGKGLLNGTQTKLKYVPEQDTDFIFCTVGEEHGFVGSVLVLGIYLVFMMRLVLIAERQRKTFSRIYGYCVVSIFFFHFLINIGMVLGLTPVIGIPLPFFSYGGSSLWGFTILLFILLRLDAARLEELN